MTPPIFPTIADGSNGAEVQSKVFAWLLPYGSRNRATRENMTLVVERLQNMTPALETEVRRARDATGPHDKQQYYAALRDLERWKERLAIYADRVNKAPPGHSFEIASGVVAPLILGQYDDPLVGDLPGLTILYERVPTTGKRCDKSFQVACEGREPIRRPLKQSIADIGTPWRIVSFREATAAAVRQNWADWKRKDIPGISPEAPSLLPPWAGPAAAVLGALLVYNAIRKD